MTACLTHHTRDFAGYNAREKIGETRHVTPKGFLVLEGTPIARIGPQLYHASELEWAGMEPDSRVQCAVTLRRQS